MPVKQRQQPAQNPPSSAASKASAKYTNKDGSKFITIPKAAELVDSPEPSPSMAQTSTKQNGQAPVAAPDTNGTAPAVNRKKQKRREKEKAKAAAQQAANPQPNGTRPSAETRRQMEELEQRFQNHNLQEPYDEANRYEGDAYETDEAEDYPNSYQDNGHPPQGHNLSRQDSFDPSLPPSRTARRNAPSSRNHHATHNGVMHHHISLPIPPLVPTNMPRGPGISKEKIWNTSSQEERERIKEFWLSLGEDERKSLVKVEKDAVLKKMKEQQKHSCSCTVCGRKRTAIEEELEVLYDAYYEELEQYANHHEGPPPMMPPPRRFGALSGLQPPHRLPTAYNTQQPSRGRIVEQLGDEEDDEEDEEYSDQEGEEDEYSEEEEPEELPRNSHATDFFNFGASLTVQGGILTVADDLLKNDGKKFIEMMEQLAERRMAREEDQRDQYNPNYGHPPNGAMHSHSHNHNHPPPVEEDEYDDDEDEEEYESGEDDDYDEDEEMVCEDSLCEESCSNHYQDTMTEEQRMEEGRRMFQIFAARMFEQRVLTAYKEKIAKERQNTLLEELDAEALANEQKKAKKAKDAQKKKEKLAQKKQLAAEEKAKREADKAAEEAAKLAAEQKKLEDQRQKAEEKRKKREAQKKAEEEERLRKEAEKQKRLQDQRDRQAEAERKQREAKERERKEKEDQRQKEKDAKDAKEREIKEKREKLEREKREREAQAKLEKQAKEAKDKSARDEVASQKAVTQAAHVAPQAAKRVQPPVPIPASLQPAAVASPHVPIVTPAIPKAPTPIKLRRTTSSQVDSNASLPATPQTSSQTQNTSPPASTPSQGSPAPSGPHRVNTLPFLHHPQASSPIHSALKSPPGINSPFGGFPHMGIGAQPNGPPMGGPFGRLPPELYPGRFAPGPIPNGMPFHPMHSMPPGRGFPMQQPPPGFAHPPHHPAYFAGAKENGPVQPHSRQASGSFDKPVDALNQAAAQPIARPAPIGRPASIVHGQRHGDSRTPDVEDLSHHLGSSALLDESDVPMPPGPGARRPSAAPGNVRPPGFPQPQFGMDGIGFGSPMIYGNTWGNAPNVFGGSPLPGQNFWPPAPGFGGPMMNTHQSVRQSSMTPYVARLLTIEACKELKKTKAPTADDFFDISKVKHTIAQRHPNEQPVSEDDILAILDTEGSPMNGGGGFDVRKDAEGQRSIRYLEDVQPLVRAGEIGSPIIGSVGSVGMPRFAGPPPGF